MKCAAFVAVLAVAMAAHAEQATGDGWETVTTGDITIKTRSVPGSPVREVLAEADLDAPAREVQEAVLDPERFPNFMPFVKEVRFIGQPGQDGSRVVYTRLQVPIIAGRDYVIAQKVLRSLNADGTGEFSNEWRVADGLVPERANTVRLKTCTGSWRVTPLGTGAKTRVVYQFAIDPGGQIPPFLADLGNRSAVPDVFRALAKEAKRLKALRGT